MQIIGIGRNFIRGGVECNIHCDRGDLHYMTDCMNINEVSRVKYWGGGGGGGGWPPPVPTPMQIWKPKCHVHRPHP